MIWPNTTTLQTRYYIHEIQLINTDIKTDTTDIEIKYNLLFKNKINVVLIHLGSYKKSYFNSQFLEVKKALHII